jgi:hypothetical protein
METSAEPGAARINAGPPVRFSGRVIGAIILVGILLSFPLLGAGLLLTVVGVTWVSAAVFASALGLIIFFLPLRQGNPYLKKLVRSFAPEAGSSPNSFVAQLTFSPRLRTGLRAVLEDADDVGCLSIGETALIFRGDSVELVLPFAQVAKCERRSAGLRKLFSYGPSTVLHVSGLTDLTMIEFAERSSCVVTTSRRLGRSLYDQVCARCMAPARGATGH